jgi:hypothetical protein
LLLPTEQAMLSKTRQLQQIMPSITCLACKRIFKGSQYFTQHLNYKKNEECRIAFCHHLRGFSPGSSPFASSPAPNDAYTPSTKRQKTGSSGLTGHKTMSNATYKPARRALNMGTAAAEQPQQEEHFVLLEEEQDGFMDDTFFPADEDDNLLGQPPIQPVNAPEIEDTNPQTVNDKPDHPDKSKILDEFQEFVNNSLKNRS